MTTICQVAREQADGTCSRVEFDVIGLGGDLAIARDVGQPHAEILQAGGSNSGRELPRSQSDFSGSDGLVVVGRFQGPNAYADAKTLVDDIVKPFIPDTDDAGNELARGTPFEVGIDFDGSGLLFGAEVGATHEGACRLQYPRGTKDNVVVRLTVDVVSCLNLGGLSASYGVAGSVTDGTKLSGVFNCVAPGDGNLYCVGVDRVTIVDISTPSSPSIAGTVQDSGTFSDLRGIAVSGDTAVVADQTDDLVGVLDVSDVTAPSVQGSVSASTNLEGGSDVVIDGTDVYAAARFDQRVTSVDISTPSSPSVTDSVQVSTDANTVGQLTLADTHVLASSVNNGQYLKSVSISDPSNLSVASTLSLDSWDTRALYKQSSSVLWAADSSYISKVDISTPSSPSLTGTFYDVEISGGALFDQAVTMFDGALFLGGMDGGVRSYDLSASVDTLLPDTDVNRYDLMAGNTQIAADSNAVYVPSSTDNTITTIN